MVTKEMSEAFSKLDFADKLLRISDLRQLGVQVLLAEVCRRNNTISEEDQKKINDTCVELYENIASATEVYESMIKKAGELFKELLPADESVGQATPEQRAKMN